jgi:hypothetical protein
MWSKDGSGFIGLDSIPSAIQGAAPTAASSVLVSDLDLGHIGRDHLFYAPLISYPSALHGWVELVSRGIGITLENVPPSVVEERAREHPDRPIRELASGQRTPLVERHLLLRE